MEKNIKIVDTDNKEKHGENRCPKCGASDVTYDIKKEKLICNYCYTEFDAKEVENVEKEAKNLKEEIRTTGTKDVLKGNDVITLKCGGCGAEVVINTNETVNARCHWCRSILSVNSQIENGAVPDVVLPFKLEKSAAEEKIKNFVEKRKFFANPRFKKEFTTKNIMGVYFPYLLVDANVHASFIGKGEHLVRSYTVKINDKDEETRYDADLYEVERDFDIAIDDLTIESNSDRINKKVKKRTNNIINSIMPFDTDKCVKYEANYLAGYTSEKRDINVSDIEEKVSKEIADISRHAIKKEISYYNRGVKWEEEKIDTKGIQWMSAYLPVWLYSYQDKKKKLHYVAVNGRTGETMGSIPMNKLKLWIITLLIIAIFTIVPLALNASEGLGMISIFLGIMIALIFFFTKSSNYQNKGARHTYEKETKNEITNLTKVDNKIKRRTDLSNSRMLGANENKIEGEYTNIKNNPQ